MLVQVVHNIGGKMKVTAGPAILDTLDNDGNLAKKSDLHTTAAKQFSDQKIINVGSIRCRKAAG